MPLDITWYGFVSRRLTLGELVSLQFDPRNIANTEYLSFFGHDGAATARTSPATPATGR